MGLTQHIMMLPSDMQILEPLLQSLDEARLSLQLQPEDWCV